MNGWRRPQTERQSVRDLADRRVDERVADEGRSDRKTDQLRRQSDDLIVEQQDRVWNPLSLTPKATEPSP